MSTFDFKVGDLVYSPTINNKISKITKTNEEGNIFLNKAGWFRPTGLNQNNMPIIFPATQEWYDKLVPVYKDLEKPIVKKTSKEIIQAMLEDEWDAVPCYVHNDNKTPDYRNRRELILEVRGYGKYPFYSDTTPWKYATPFNPRTGKVIVDYVNGKEILEEQNDG